MPAGLTLQSPFTRVLLVSLLVASQCLSKLVNGTIDDTYGDTRTGVEIVFSPLNAWVDGSIDCPSCKARPNPSLFHNRTWHDSTFKPSVRNIPPVATTHFNGVGFYVYCALAQSDDPSFTTRSDMTFYVDGKEVGTFVREPPGGDGFDYDFLVYKSTPLPPGEHELSIHNGRVDGEASLMLLDRIVYMYDDSDNEGGKKQNIGAIIGGAVGGLAVLALIIAGIVMWSCRRRRQKLSEDESAKVEGNLAPNWHSNQAAGPIGGAYTYPNSMMPHEHEVPPQYEETTQVATTSRTEKGHRR